MNWKNQKNDESIEVRVTETTEEIDANQDKMAPMPYHVQQLVEIGAQESKDIERTLDKCTFMFIWAGFLLLLVDIFYLIESESLIFLAMIIGVSGDLMFRVFQTFSKKNEGKLLLLLKFLEAICLVISLVRTKADSN